MHVNVTIILFFLLEGLLNGKAQSKPYKCTYQAMMVVLGRRLVSVLGDFDRGHQLMR